MASHRDLIVEQFSRQAVPFSTAPAIMDAAALDLLVEFAGAGADDTVLDVACGPGLVVCAFAARTRHATGIDLTPAMLDRARALAREKRLTNVTWQAGDVRPLPFPDGSFSIVVSRFAFHHFQAPGAVLAEMARVCTAGGTVVCCDMMASPEPAKAAALNRMELLRDPSHVRALTLAELEALFPDAGLPSPRMTSYKLAANVEGLLATSFPNPGDADRVRQMFVDSLVDDGLGLGTRRHRDEIRFAYPVAILAASRP